MTIGMDFIGQTNYWAGVDIGEHLFLFSPMIALICTMLAIVACPLVLGRGARVISTVATLGVAVTLVLAIRVAYAVTAGGVSGLSTDAAAGMLIVDNLSAGFQIVLLLFLGGVMWLWRIGSAEKEQNAPEFFILLIGSALGMMLMVSTANLLMIVMAIEMASLPSYAIVGFDKRDRVAAEASLKYMIFGAVCAAIMLYGASLLYGLVGSLSVADLAAYIVNNIGGGRNSLLLAVGLLCFLAGIAFKVSAVPFHFWCPDAFEGAKIEVTTWLSVASKAAGLLLLARLVSILCSAVDTSVYMSMLKPIAWTIGIMAAVTCTVGNFSAYKQSSVKRMLAYSSIAHAGYMMMAAAVMIHPSVRGSSAGISALFFYIVVYALMNLGAFGVTAMVIWDTGSDDVDSFTGLMRRSPWLAVPMVLCLMSLVGIPPLAGFVGKWWILFALGSMQSGATDGWYSLNALGWILIVVVAFNTLLSLYYYMRIIVKMALYDDGRPAVRAPLSGLALVNICGFALLALTLFAPKLKHISDRVTRGMYTAVVSAPSQQATVASALPQEAE